MSAKESQDVRKFELAGAGMLLAASAGSGLAKTDSVGFSVLWSTVSAQFGCPGIATGESDAVAVTISAETGAF